MPQHTNATAQKIENINMIHAEQGENLQFLTFTVASEFYGVDILKVQEIRGWQDVTVIPNAPAYIRGVMNLRGAIVPILDMRRRFNMPEVELTQNTVVVIVNVLQRIVGIVVDGVSDVIDLTKDDLRPTPDFGNSIDAGFVSGLAALEDDMVIILNIENMLKGSDLISLDEVIDNESLNNGKA